LSPTLSHTSPSSCHSAATAPSPLSGRRASPLLPALNAIGSDDLAFMVLAHTDYPAEGFEVADGATMT
jgi:hypothetical protein